MSHKSEFEKRLVLHERIGGAKAIFEWFIRGVDKMIDIGEPVNHDLLSAYSIAKKWMNENGS